MDRLIMIAVCRRSEAAANLWLEIVFAHQPADLLVVDDQALLTKGGSDTTPPVMFELITDSGHRLDDCCVVGRMLGDFIKGGARKSHHSASLGDIDAPGPVMADILPFFRSGAGRRAPFRNSSSSACFPTKRSSAAIRAS